MTESSIALDFENISKTFGELKANQNISFQVKKGHIHAIVGENGAGKSTLMKILFGLYQKDSGKIRLNGKEINFSSPIQAKNMGLGMVHQHFMLAGPLMAVDHIILEDAKNNIPLFKKLFFPLPRKKIIQDLNKLSSLYKMPVPWESKIEDLSVGIQQRIEILKLLYNKADLLILDEPTAVLTPQEIEQLFLQLKEMKDSGKTILIITHKLKEVLKIADAVTVLRQGQSICTLPIKGQTIESLSEHMIGRKLKYFSHEERIDSDVTRVVVRNLTFQTANKTLLKDVSFEIHPNEILGIAGVEGNGQTELLNAFVRPQNTNGKYFGQIQFKNVNLLNLTSSQIRKLEVSYFPEDRIHQGLLLHANVLENFLLGKQFHSEFSKKGWILKKQVHAAVQTIFDQFDVRPKNEKLLLEKFSGGNQQKFVVGRELYHHPNLLIAAQPTRGVDIGAIETIHTEFLKQREKGTSVLLISSELDELLKLSDRILVLFNGKIMGNILRKDFNEKEIGILMTGGHS